MTLNELKQEALLFAKMVDDYQQGVDTIKTLEEQLAKHQQEITAFEQNMERLDASLELLCPPGNFGRVQLTEKQAREKRLMEERYIYLSKKTKDLRVQVANEQKQLAYLKAMPKTTSEIAAAAAKLRADLSEIDFANHEPGEE